MKLISSKPHVLESSVKTYVVSMVSGKEHTVTISPELGGGDYWDENDVENPFYLTEPIESLKYRIRNRHIHGNINYGLIEDYHEESSKPWETTVFEKYYRKGLFCLKIKWDDKQ